MSCLYSLATDSGWHCKFRSTQTIYNLLYQYVEDSLNAKHDKCIKALLTWLNLQYGVRWHNYLNGYLKQDAAQQPVEPKGQMLYSLACDASLGPRKTQISGNHLCSSPVWCSVSSRDHQFHSLYSILFWFFSLCAGMVASVFSDL